VVDLARPAPGHRPRHDEPAIADIIEDGEGTHVDAPSSHYARFTRLRASYVEEGCFEAARQVVDNPATVQRRDADAAASILENADTREVAKLFNGVYFFVVSLLLYYFAKGGESAPQRAAMKSAAARSMSIAIRPLAEILTELPFAAADDPRRAGAPFELPGPVFLPPSVEARWTMTFERLDAIIAACGGLAGPVPRLAGIGETFSYMRRSLAQAVRET
jgi:hypothetical protein